MIVDPIRSGQKERAPRACSVLLGLGLALAGGAAEAANWWAVSDGASGAVVSLDVQQLNCRGGVCSLPQRLGRSGERGGGAIHTVDYECAGLRSRENGSDWRPIAPNSLGEAMLTFACTYQARSFGLGSAESMNADGRTFQRLTHVADAATAPEAASLPASAKGARSPTAKPVQLASAPPIRAPAKPVEMTPSPAAGVAAVQIAAAATQGQAEQSLTSAKGRAGDLLKGTDVRIEPADVGGRKVYRAILVGFPDIAAAQQTCAKLKQRAIACFVRR